MNALNDLKWLILMIIGLVIAASLLRSEGGLGSLITPISPLDRLSGTSLRQGDSGDNTSTNKNSEDGVVEDIEIDIKDVRGSFEKIKNLSNSKYKDIVLISNNNGRDSSPDRERVEIRVKRGIDEKIPITNWRLESAVTGKSVSIAQGTYLPYSARVNSESYIFLEAGEKAVIITGRSPIGVSFRLNQCIGYFEQFQDFIPSLPRRCPDPVDDMPNFGAGDLAEACFDFVDRLPHCEIYLNALPGNLGGACLNYINQKINYNTCVDNHKDDSDFYTGEWRIYLARDQELWKNKREIIKLIDNEGKVVDVVTY